jgi:hypothetical protein
VSVGCTPEEAWDRVRAIRPFVSPTDVQEAALQAFGDSSARTSPAGPVRTVD